LSVTTLVLTASGPFARLKAWGLKRILICDWRFGKGKRERGNRTFTPKASSLYAETVSQFVLKSIPLW
jgi:hypothetical protein